MCDMTRSKDIDWAAIKTEHEQGISQRSLAAKYGISQASISKRAIKEQWVVQPVINAEVAPAAGDDPHAIADQALADLCHHLNGKPEQPLCVTVTTPHGSSRGLLRTSRGPVVPGHECLRQH